MTNETCAICAEKSRDEQFASPSRRLLSEKNTSMLQRMAYPVTFALISPIPLFRGKPLFLAINLALLTMKREVKRCTCENILPMDSMCIPDFGRSVSSAISTLGRWLFLWSWRTITSCTTFYLR